MSAPEPPADPAPIDPNRYPRGWDRARAEALIAHYDDQAARGWPEDDEPGEIDPDTHCRITIPRDLLPEVRELLAERARQPPRTQG